MDTFDVATRPLSRRSEDSGLAMSIGSSRGSSPIGKRNFWFIISPLDGANIKPKIISVFWPNFVAPRIVRQILNLNQQKYSFCTLEL